MEVFIDIGHVVIWALFLVTLVVALVVLSKAFTDARELSKKDIEDEEKERLLEKVNYYALLSWISMVGSVVIGIGMLWGYWWLAFGVIAIMTFVYRGMFDKYMKSGSKAASILTAALAAVVALALLAVSVVASPPTQKLEASWPQSEEAVQSEDTVGTPVAIVQEDCPAEFVQVVMPNDDTRISEQFAERLVQIRLDSKSVEEADRAEFISVNTDEAIREEMGVNVRMLVSAARAAELISDTDDPGLLVTPDLTCLSEKGQLLYKMTIVAMDATIEGYTQVDAVPQGLVNSAWHEDQLVVASEAGIWGDARGVKLTLKDGTNLFILERCGNWLFSPKGKLVTQIPKGPTDNPPPTTTTRTPGKGLSGPESEHGFWGQTPSGGGETTAPTGPSVSNDGGNTWTQTKPASPSTKPGSVAPTVQAPSTGTKPAENNNLNTVTPPTGGVTVDPGVSGTTNDGGSATETDAGSDNTKIEAPAD